MCSLLSAFFSFSLLRPFNSQKCTVTTRVVRVLYSDSLVVETRYDSKVGGSHSEVGYVLSRCADGFIAAESCGSG